jgi:hypothetical protein
MRSLKERNMKAMVEFYYIVKCPGAFTWQQNLEADSDLTRVQPA